MLICPLPETAVFTFYEKEFRNVIFIQLLSIWKKHAYVHLLTAMMCQSLHFIKVLFLVYSMWEHFPQGKAFNQVIPLYIVFNSHSVNSKQLGCDISAWKPAAWHNNTITHSVVADCPLRERGWETGYLLALIPVWQFDTARCFYLPVCWQTSHFTQKQGNL